MVDEEINYNEQKVVEKFEIDYVELGNSEKINMNGRLLKNAFDINNKEAITFTIRAISESKEKIYQKKTNNVVYISLEPLGTLIGKVFSFDEEGKRIMHRNEFDDFIPILEDGELTYYLDSIKFAYDENELTSAKLNNNEVDFEVVSYTPGYYLLEALLIEGGYISEDIIDTKSNRFKFNSEVLKSLSGLEVDLCVLTKENSKGYKPSTLLVHPKRYEKLLQLKAYS